MRNLFLGLFALLLSVSAFAQDGEAALKAAGKAISNFKVNGDEMKLQEAVDNIAIAMQDDAAMSDYKAYLEAGDIYSAAINAYVNARILSGEAEEVTVPNAAAKAAAAYMKAYNMSEKKGGKKDALEGLEALQGNLSNEGIYAIQDGRYGDSYTTFAASLEANDFLNANGGTSAFTEEQANDETYYAALSAVQTEQNDAAEPLLMKLRENGYEEAAIYDNLYKLYVAKDDKAKAAEMLAEGREKFPDATSLLFTEINYYLSEGKLDVLTGKLEEAIEKEPENVSLYATLGSVYDKLYQMNAKEGKAEEAAQYFDLANKNYESGLQIDPDNSSVIYSIGALYYNRAAAMTEDLVALGDDYSKEGQKKYEALKVKVDGEFEKALPFFKKAEMKNPNDVNTLIALKEMYARMDEFEVSAEFKARYERVQGGGTNEKSYFAENGM